MAPQKKAAAKPRKKTGVKPKTIGDSHKNALAKGRREAGIIRAYLDSIRANKPRRGRKRTAETVRKQLDAVRKQLDAGIANPTDELKAVQRKMDLERELRGNPKMDVKKLEASFVKVAKSYSDRLGITAAAWRKVGVQDAVLKRAGINK